MSKRRLFLLGVGVVAGVIVFRKLNSGKVNQDTGSAFDAQKGGLLSAARGFLDDVRSAMNEREGELLAVLDRPAPTPEDVRAVFTEPAYTPRHAAP